MDPRLVFLFRSSEITPANRENVLAIMAEKASFFNKIDDPIQFLEKVMERERLISTSVGRQVALPHAKMEGIADFFVVLAHLSQGIDWQSIDNMPVRLVFMIGGPRGKEPEYLDILSEITHLIRDEERLKKILTAKSQEAIIRLLFE